MCLCYIVPADSSCEAYIEINVLDRISDHILQIANETNKAKKKYMCVSGFIPRKNRVGRSDLIFIFS